jgi:hypothetical protein
MKEYPHGLDEEILPEDLETQQELIARLEPFLEQAYAEKKSALFKGLGKCSYAAGCCSYALENPSAETNGYLQNALKYLYTAFEFGIPQTAYDFIRLLSLAVVAGNSEIAAELSQTPRKRYTNENVEVEEITFVIAELLSGFVRKDKNAVAGILEKNSFDKIESSKIFRSDRLLYLPLLRLFETIYKKDSNMFAKGLQMRQTDFVKFLTRTDRKNDPDALIDMPGLALAFLAKKHGLSFSDASVYRPYDLIKAR